MELLQTILNIIYIIIAVAFFIAVLGAISRSKENEKKIEVLTKLVYKMQSALRKDDNYIKNMNEVINEKPTENVKTEQTKIEKEIDKKVEDIDFEKLAQEEGYYDKEY